jgi:hypothetical protein
MLSTFHTHCARGVVNISIIKSLSLYILKIRKSVYFGVFEVDHQMQSIHNHHLQGLIFAEQSHVSPTPQ